MTFKIGDVVDCVEAESHNRWPARVVRRVDGDFIYVRGQHAPWHHTCVSPHVWSPGERVVVRGDARPIGYGNGTDTPPPPGTAFTVAETTESERADGWVMTTEARLLHESWLHPAPESAPEEKPAGPRGYPDLPTLEEWVRVRQSEPDAFGLYHDTIHRDPGRARAAKTASRTVKTPDDDDSFQIGLPDGWKPEGARVNPAEVTDEIRVEHIPPFIHLTIPRSELPGAIRELRAGTVYNGRRVVEDAAIASDSDRSSGRRCSTCGMHACSTFCHAAPDSTPGRLHEDEPWSLRRQDTLEPTVALHERDDLLPDARPGRKPSHLRCPCRRRAPGRPVGIVDEATLADLTCEGENG